MSTAIAAASGEQTSGIEQVNRAIMDMDNVTQQNAALVEKAAAAAQALQERATHLESVVSTFKLSNQEAIANAGSPPANSGADVVPLKRPNPQLRVIVAS